ncbi:hypothetical protein BsWGS_17303 [Bradybaena similaris]
MGNIVSWCREKTCALKYAYYRFFLAGRCPIKRAYQRKEKHFFPEPLIPPVPTNTVAQGASVLLSAGTYEVELNWEGESELHKLKKHCQKHRGHDKFIPSQEFDEQHLPDLYKHKLIVDLVRCLSTLTVRLTVGKISASRPRPPYPPTPRCDNLGRDCSINGTGHVSSAVVSPEEADNCCACSECLESGSPERRFGKIFIQTAAHVVHDDSEAANTTCYFNYVNDSDGLDTAIKIQGAKGVQIDVKEDRCWMFCYTHDLSLLKKLDSTVHMYQRLRREVADKYCVNWADTPEDKLTIIVSHPHGCSKYVTVGNMEGRLAAEDDADWTQYTYTTPTCPGSSGAPIFMLGKHGYIDNHHHSGTNPNTGLNVSTFGLF